MKLEKDKATACLFPSIRNSRDKATYNENTIDVNFFSSDREKCHDCFSLHHRLLILYLTEYLINKFNSCYSIDHRRISCFTADITIESLTV